MSYLPPPSALPPGSIVDSYRRDSGGPRQDQSTEQQLVEIQAYCAAHGLVLRHNFVDVARSGGSTVGREDFNRMLDLYRTPSQRPHGLLLWNYARFARDLDDAIYYKALLRNRQIAVHSLTDPIPEGQYGRIIEFFIDISNEEKRRQTSTDARRGLRELVLKYGCVSGVPPIGFKREPVHIGQRRDGSSHIAHRWVPDPELIPRVRQAFEMRAAGSSLSAIMQATRLYNSVNSYKTFFTNRIYIGILEFGDLTVENYCEPIIDINTWNTVQKIVQDYARARTSERHPRRTNSVYLLSGLAYCNQCGAPLYGNTVTRERIHGRDEAYRCSRARRRRDCTAGRITRRILEEAVLNTLREYILLPEAISAMHQIALESRASFETDRVARRSTLLSQRGKLSTQIANITKAIADRGPLLPLLDKLTELNGQRAQLNTELQNLEIPLQSLPALTPDQLAAQSEKLLEALSTAPIETVRTLLQSFIKEIRVERREKEIIGTITYYYPPPFDYASTGTLPIGSASVEAPLYRQTFTHPSCT